MCSILFLTVHKITQIKYTVKPIYICLFLSLENKKAIDSVMMILTKSITNRAMTGICRDAIIELITRNVSYKALEWTVSFLRIEGWNCLFL